MIRKTFAQVCSDEVAELREIAVYFDQRGNKINGDFLRSVARRYEYLYRVYDGASKCAACGSTGQVLDGELCQFCAN